MYRNIKEKFNYLISWIKQHFNKIVVIAVAHFGITNISNLPYLNLIKILLVSLPFIVDWILILILFKPKKETILKIGLWLFFVAFWFELFHFSTISESLGNLIYLFIATYVIISLKEIKNSK